MQYDNIAAMDKTEAKERTKNIFSKFPIDCNR